ncbi:carboxypeptidase 1 [Clostridia bacterium]|nr:carboxypeptidase 1 [Clostridia bacterium]
MEELLKDFNAFLDRLYSYNVAASVLYWENRTDGPKGGLRTRGKAAAALSTEAFKLAVSDEMKGYLDKLAENKDKLTVNEAAKLRILKKNYDDTKNIPPAEYEEFKLHLIEAETVWEKAKNTNDYALFAPYLAKNIEFSKKFARYKDADKPLYEVLLSDYEPGLTIAELDAFFDKLRKRIVPLLKKVKESGKTIRSDFLTKPVPVEIQAKIGRKLAEMLSFDFDRGEIKEAEHPFTLQLSKYDVRITTHYHENMFLSSVYSVLHETGHALYEQNKDDEIAETVLDCGVSMAIHESQSRFYENVIGRSREFWAYAWDVIKADLGADFADVTAEEIYRAANLAKASLIRIEADELTYALHIMVRYEIEKALFDENSDINVADLPRIWNEKYTEYLGVTPSNDALGILQDTHWSGAGFGYFPSYALGSAYAAQYLAKMNGDFDVYEAVKKGEISKVTDWLKDKIHRHGSVKEPKELFEAAVGGSFNADYFLDYLENKFGEIYDLN